jgi:hypothetical protein
MGALYSAQYSHDHSVLLPTRSLADDSVGGIDGIYDSKMVAWCYKTIFCHQMNQDRTR